GNFVRLNLRRRSYSRWCRRGKSLRKRVWREKWRKKRESFGGGASGSDVCFRCGTRGHWASECPGLAPDSPDSPDIPDFPDSPDIPDCPDIPDIPDSPDIPDIPDSPDSPDSPDIPDCPDCPDFPDFLDSPDTEGAPGPVPEPVEPIYNLGENGEVPDPPPEVLEALRELGHSSFRPGQAEAVMRILCGLSTLLVLPTGTGKSLCYQIPALLFHRHRRALTLVVSPLVSLMDDQVSGLPRCLRAVRVHSQLPRRESGMEKVRAGEAQVLFVSPESLLGVDGSGGCSGGSGWAFPAGRDRLPPVAFACLDEAHCVSR
ncbi:RECQ4 helicase, partial [Neopipo cinnamomea]|nr:RECQ4 helicase [Neopipo cinnamomea]